MDKVTYEEESINIWGHKFTKEEFDNLVAGFKPPTYEEVVKVWEEIGYAININNEYYDFEAVKRIMHMEYVIAISNKDYIKLSINHTWKNKRETPTYILFEENHAINLTIRYLEAREKDNE